MYFTVCVVYCVMMFYRDAVTQNSLSTVFIMAQDRAMNIDTFHKVPNSTHLKRLSQYTRIILWEK